MPRIERHYGETRTCSNGHQFVLGAGCQVCFPPRAATPASPVEQTENTTARAATATERQVNYALDLQRAYWTPAVFGGQRYSREQLQQLGRDEISTVIDTLLGERELAGR